MDILRLLGREPGQHAAEAAHHQGRHLFVQLLGQNLHPHLGRFVGGGQVGEAVLI